MENAGSVTVGKSQLNGVATYLLRACDSDVGSHGFTRDDSLPRVFVHAAGTGALEADFAVGKGEDFA